MERRKYRIKNKTRWRVFISIISAILLALIIYILYTYNNQPSYAETKQIENNISDLHIRTVQIEPMTVFEYGMMLDAQNPKVDAPERIYYDIPLSKELQDYTYEQCKRWDNDMNNIPETLVFALFHKESRFDPFAVSKYNCKGIGQLSPNTFKNTSYALEIQQPDIFNVRHNIACTVYQLSVLRDSYEKLGYSDEELFYCMLGAFNNGSIIYDRNYRNRGVLKTDYARKVLEYKEQLEQYKTITE